MTVEEGNILRVNGCSCIVTKSEDNYIELTPLEARHKITSTPGEPFNIVKLKNAYPNGSGLGSNV